jgi:methionyl-tRNA synthetase
MVQVSVKCPYCKKSLMDEEHRVDDLPSVAAVIQHGNKRGNLYLSSLYGSYNLQSDMELQMEEIYVFFCPHCNSVLLTKAFCDTCNAPMVAFEFVGGTRLRICSRRGCKKHFIEFENLEKQISAFYSAYPVFVRPARRKKEEREDRT